MEEKNVRKKPPPPTTRFGAAAELYRATLRQRDLTQAPRLAFEFFLRSTAGQRFCMRLPGIGAHSREYVVDLPAGFPARQIRVRVSIPQLPSFRIHEFSEHLLDENGRATPSVLATTKGGFTISDDLGASWRSIRPRGYARHEFVHVKALGNSEFVAQAVLPAWKQRGRQVDTLVVHGEGGVLAATRLAASPWHGCRSVDLCGGVLMFAEYPYEGAGRNRLPCRVFRSLDRGRSWQIVFEQASGQVRHFHFLQARPGRAGEWWLSSGDLAVESRVWRTIDDGETWNDISQMPAVQIPVDGGSYPRSVFRLTDLVWRGDEAIWGTDNVMPALGGAPRGGKVLRAACADALAPCLIGTTRWHVRNIVDLGEFWLIITQGPLNLGATREERRPGVYLLQKRESSAAPGLVHLFDVETYSPVPTGFTYSRASRTARDGVFFTSRSGTDVFPFGHKLLKWEVAFS